MTGTQIHTLALSYLTETPSESSVSEEMILGWINVLIGESLPYENSVREFEERAPLTLPPYLSALSDQVDYCDGIARLAIPYGLASFLFSDDDNEFRAQDFRGRYLSALNDAKKLIVGEIVDVYKDGDV